jgi:hypothetical protein
LLPDLFLVRIAKKKGVLSEFDGWMDGWVWRWMSFAWLRFYIRGEVGAEEAGGNEGISRCAPCESFFF